MKMKENKQGGVWLFYRRYIKPKETKVK